MDSCGWFKGATSLAAAGVLLALAGFPRSLHAEVPHVFSDGNVALASEINENFAHIDAMIKEATSSGPGTTIDCDANPDALQEAVNAGYTTIKISQGMCNTSFTYRKTLEIYGETGAGGEFLAGLKQDGSVPLSLDTSVISISSLDIEVPISNALGTLAMSNVNVDCAGFVNAASTRALSVWNSSGYVLNSTFSGCTGVEVTGSSRFWIGGSSITPLEEHPALFVGTHSSLESIDNEYFPTSASESWLMNVSGSATFTNDQIKGGMYMPRARVVLRGVTFTDNGSGIIDLSPHFGGSLSVSGGVYSNVNFGTFRGGDIHITHDPDNSHDGTSFSVDGGGQLSFGGAFTGENTSVFAAHGAYILLGDWEAAGAVQNTVDVSLGFSSFISVGGNVNGSAVSCRDGLVLEAFSDGQSCVNEILE